MNRKFFKDISATALQVLFNQAAGLFLFVLISRYLPKESYGELNWTLAVLNFMITILSLRMEQVVTRKIASGENPERMFSIFAKHCFGMGLVSFSLIFLIQFILPDFFQKHSLFTLLAISQFLSFFSLPCKTLAAGQEKYSWFALFSSVSNMVKLSACVFLLFSSGISIKSILVIFISASVIEVFCCFWVTRFRFGIAMNITGYAKEYKDLLRESFPQTAAVFFNACVARIDWILLGIFTGTVVTAEYSFAYRCFELSPLPLLIISPVLLSRFSKFFKANSETALNERNKDLDFLIRMEMIAATLLPLILVLIWETVIDAITRNKYGSVNTTTFILLSMCIPFQYLNNLFWTVEFTQGRLKRIFIITAIVGSISLLGNLIMIPAFKAAGAALTCLLVFIAEFLLYRRVSVLEKLREGWKPLLICCGVGFGAGFLAKQISNAVPIQLLTATAVYCIFILITRQVKKDDLLIIRQILKNSGA